MHTRALALLCLCASLVAQGSAVTFGNGCPAGQSRALGFAPNPGGGRLALHEAGALPGSPTLAWLGISRTSWNAVPLPLDLTPAGLPGCAIAVSLDVATPIAVAADGRAEAFWPVPADASLLSQRLFGQWLNPADPRVAPALPVTTSQGVEFALGPVLGFPGLIVTGDPRGSNGATWTYQATVGGVAYDLAGILFVPPTPAPGGRLFPAVVISHGAGGNANAYARGMARTMVGFGLVCIGANLTHAGGVPIGSPGTATERGASPANALRIRKCVDILQSLGYVDVRRVAAHGHSMGAWATGGTLGLFPDTFLVGSHTAGGLSDQPGAAATTPAQARAIRTPYQLHHGDADTVVPLIMDQRLAAVLAANPTIHELHVYPGYDHAQIAQDAGMFARVRAWYALHGLF